MELTIDYDNSRADTNSRQQVTLFVPDPARSLLEAIRMRLDPVQYRLIPAHVTLCRENELAALPYTGFEALRGAAQHAPLTLHFGPPEVFDGHGVLLPCIAGGSHFHRLRVAILGTEDLPPHRAHITLAHPRNPRAPGNLPSTYASLTTPFTITLSRLSLVEQHGSAPWQVRRAIDLVGSDA